MNAPLQAPFPYFGGKRKVAQVVWDRFGDVPNFVEPFFGSGAMLLARPSEPQLETVNDLDGLVSNFWRALQADREAVAYYADWPVNENDLHARHMWLVQRKDSLQAKLEGDPDFHDAKAAGWWCWGMCAWIGSGFCSGQGPWKSVDGQLVHSGSDGQGINRQLVHLTGGQGINRQLVHLTGGRGINRKLVHLAGGRGINRKLVHLGDKGMGINRKLVQLRNSGEGINAVRGAVLYDYFEILANRLRSVRVCCGDWSRVLGPSVTFTQGLTGIFLDPPYSEQAVSRSKLYRQDSMVLAQGVREWAIENGENELLRIALCGYEGEHAMPESWECFGWNAGAGYGGQAEEQTDNGKRERVWFSPHCLKANRLQPELSL